MTKKAQVAQIPKKGTKAAQKRAQVAQMSTNQKTIKIRNFERIFCEKSEDSKDIFKSYENIEIKKTVKINYLHVNIVMQN